MPPQRKPRPAGSGDIEPDFLRSLLRQCEQLSDDGKRLAGEQSALLKGAKEIRHLHVQAFKSCLRLNQMEPGQRAEYLRCFDSYRHMLELDDQMDLEDLIDGGAETKPARRKTKTLGSVASYADNSSAA